MGGSAILGQVRSKKVKGQGHDYIKYSLTRQRHTHQLLASIASSNIVRVLYIFGVTISMFSLFMFLLRLLCPDACLWCSVRYQLTVMLLSHIETHIFIISLSASSV